MTMSRPPIRNECQTRCSGRVHGETTLGESTKSFGLYGPNNKRNNCSSPCCFASCRSCWMWFMFIRPHKYPLFVQFVFSAIFLWVCLLKSQEFHVLFCLWCISVTALHRHFEACQIYRCFRAKAHFWRQFRVFENLFFLKQFWFHLLVDMA